MTDKVQLKHPRGKTPVKMSKEKYNLLKPAVLKYLRAKKKATFGELSGAIAKEFKAKGQAFEGSLPWHLEWVKLDLEARKVIRRVPGSTPQQYVLVN